MVSARLATLGTVARYLAGASGATSYPPLPRTDATNPNYRLPCPPTRQPSTPGSGRSPSRARRDQDRPSSDARTNAALPDAVPMRVRPQRPRSGTATPKTGARAYELLGRRGRVGCWVGFGSSADAASLAAESDMHAARQWCRSKSPGCLRGLGRTHPQPSLLQSTRSSRSQSRSRPGLVSGVASLAARLITGLGKCPLKPVGVLALG